MKTGIYVLAVPGKPSLSTQRADLANLIARRGCEVPREYQDTHHAVDPSRRQGVRSLLADVRKRVISVVAVWRLSFLFRDVRMAVRTLTDVLESGVRFISFQEGIDTGGSPEEGFRRAIKSLAQLEKDARSEKIKIGLARAVQAGTKVGRPTKDLDAGRVMELRSAGLSIRGIAKETGISKSRIALVLRQVVVACPEALRTPPETGVGTYLDGPKDASQTLLRLFGQEVQPLEPSSAVEAHIEETPNDRRS